MADKTPLSQLSRQLTDVATLSKALGYSVVAGMTSALELVNHPALVLDQMGFVIDSNAAAAVVFDDEVGVRQRRLVVKDAVANAELGHLLAILRSEVEIARNPQAIVVRRQRRLPLVIKILPIPAAARTPFLGACALLVLTDLGQQTRPQVDILRKAFQLSAAEAKLASLIAAGVTPQQAAEKLGIARETARNQLKAVFNKTATHRQSELVALLRKL